MANIPGLSSVVMPNAYSRVQTLTRAVSIPGGLRIMAVVGEGLREEVLVQSAQGSGQDGFDPTFTSASDGYGRFFRTAATNLVENRTQILLNGSPLRVLEDSISSTPFSSRYDARIEPETGKIELQAASLVDQGGIDYIANSNNTGDGYLDNIVLVDSNAPEETWTIRCVSVLRDSYGAPRRGEATFTASGSVSGQLVDDYGQPFTWRSDGASVSNAVISFGVFNVSPATTFEVGDRFDVEVASRVLQERDTLEARYIAESDLNVAATFTDPNKLFARYGQPSTTNTLSIGAQIAYENGATSVLALQAKPPLPRRTSEIVLPALNSVTSQGGASGNATAEDLIFAIEAPGKPDLDTEVRFFVLNTDGTETQVFPNKVSFYDPDITQAFSIYEDSGSDTLLLSEFMAPGSSGYPFSYTVVSDDRVEQASTDGVIAPIGLGTTAYFSSASAAFTAADLTAGKKIDIFNTATANLGRYDIVEIVSATMVRISRASGSFISETGVKWQLLTTASDSQRVLFTTDLALAVGQGLRVSYIDQRDADFFDAGWFEALDELESQDLQILVLMPTQTFSAIQQAGRVHVERMSSTFYRRERVMITGALQGLTLDNVNGVSLAAPEDIGILEGIQGDSAEEILDGNIEDLADYSVANNFGDSFRVVWMYPDEVVRPINGTRTLLPGYYMAPALAGWFAGEANIVQPATNKVLVGFTILNDKVFKDTELNTLADNGICVVQPVTGGGRVLWGKTTTQSGAPEEEEASIVFIRDHLARTMRRSFQAFIGQAESPTLIPSLTSRAIGLLNAFISQNIITAYRNLSVTRDDVEPRQYNIVFEAQPNYPVNWVFIDISVGLF